VDLGYEEDVADDSRVGVRVIMASGADASCEQPLPDDYLHIVSVTDDAGNTARAGDSAGELELVIPAAAGRRRLTVRLVDPVSDPRLIELDLVKRKVAAPQDGRESGKHAKGRQS